MKISFVACLMAIVIVSGCSQKAQTVNVVDVSKQETLALKTTSSDVSGISLHVQGQLDGEAVLSAANWQPQKVNGKVDFEVYHDWFEPKCDLQYQPLTATTGTLTVQYTFHR
jgi:PBP1b-binding outer membrane lipoprotein LpoB